MRCDSDGVEGICLELIEGDFVTGDMNLELTSRTLGRDRRGFWGFVGIGVAISDCVGGLGFSDAIVGPMI